MKWHGAWLCGVHRTCAETAAVSCGTSHASAVSTPTSVGGKNKQTKKTHYRKASHSCRIKYERDESARERRIALYKSDQQLWLLGTELTVDTGWRLARYWLDSDWTQLSCMDIEWTPARCRTLAAWTPGSSSKFSLNPYPDPPPPPPPPPPLPTTETRCGLGRDCFARDHDRIVVPGYSVWQTVAEYAVVWW